MESKRRDLILQVADGDPRTFPILYQLDRFVHADKMFAWMLANGIKGKYLVEVVSENFKHSWLTFGKWVVMRVNKDTQLRSVIAGKDFKTN